jgi:hypothetical protein
MRAGARSRRFVRILPIHNVPPSGTCDERKFKTAAQVDQALWTLQLGVYGGRLENTEDIKAAHQSDPFLRTIRVKNLADALFGSMSAIDLAEALSFDRLEVASQLLSLEFERAVREYAGKAPVSDDLKAIIDAHALANLKGLWQQCRALRNRAVHARPLDHKEAEELIKATRQILDLSNIKRSR